MRRKDLQDALELVPEFSDPSPRLEQYRTPATIAAKFLLEANFDDDILDKDVLDLGCGTGMFCRGALLLGAKSCTGIDIDEAAVNVARECVPDATFVVDDVAPAFIEATGLQVDTVIMNPPFGAQNKGADRPFLETAFAALRTGGACWFLQLPQNAKFLRQWCQKKGMKLEEVARWSYPLEAKHWFHTDAVRKVEVAAFTFRKP